MTLRLESIFGVIDERNSHATLPPLSPNGFWSDFVVIDARQFRFALNALQCGLWGETAL